jgi:hypothetical protein
VRSFSNVLPNPLSPKPAPEISSPLSLPNSNLANVYLQGSHGPVMHN